MNGIGKQVSVHFVIKWKFSFDGKKVAYTKSSACRDDKICR